MRFIFVTFLVLCASRLLAQPDYDTRVNNYVQQYKDIAVEEMKRVHIPASIILAQGILESDAGQSPLATDANNHFGIKCHDDWKGNTYTYDDDKKDECFRKYSSASESYKDHSDFLRNKDRYAFLFNYGPTDYKDWAAGLKQAGYATNPKYAQLLVSNIEKYKLYQYDYPATDNPQRQDSIVKVIAAAPAKAETPSLPDADNIGARVFYINRVRAVQLAPGETLEQLGRRFDIGLRRVLKYNDWATEPKAPPGTVIFLQPKRRAGDDMYHIVQGNETMWDIAQLHGIQLESLYRRNKMEEGQEPAKGEVIYLQGVRETVVILRNQDAGLRHQTLQNEPVNLSPPGARLAATQPAKDTLSSMTLTASATQHSDSSASYITVPDDYKYYTVKVGDTLYSIARAYNLDVEKLKEMNKLYSDIISTGMRLKIAE